MAASALMLAIQLMPSQEKQPVSTTSGVWNKTLEYYSGYTENTLKGIAKKLALIVRSAPVAKLQAVHCKYKNNKHGQISIHAALADACLDAIISAQ